MPPASPVPVLVSLLQTRQPWRAHALHVPEAPRPTAEALREALEAAAPGPRALVWIGGGEPTLRADLPKLIRQLSSETGELGLTTDGLVLASGPALRVLHDAGLARLRIHLHSARAEVHDWIVGQRGAARRARKAIQNAVQMGIPTEADLLLSRPGARWLPATVQLLARLGVARVHLRRPLRRGPGDRDFIASSPRLGLLQEHLDRALVIAREVGLTVRLHGVPACAAPRADAEQLTGGAEQLLWPEGLGDRPEVRAWGAAPPAPACPACPGPPGCPGAPADYVDRFGDLELQSERPGPLRRPRPSPPRFGETPPVPPPRRGRSPATRPHVSGRLAAWPDIGGDPTSGQPGGDGQATVELVLDGPTRALRRTLVRLAQDGPEGVRLVALAPAPTHLELVREALRLGFSRLELWAGPGVLDGISARQLGRLKGLHHVRIGLADPGAAPEAAALAERVAAKTGAPTAVVGWLAALPAAGSQAAWAGLWPEQLPGAPAFARAAGLAPPSLESWAAAAPQDLAAALRSAAALPSPPPAESE